VVPSRGDPRRLERLLGSLRAASGPVPGEVIVVGGETDDAGTPPVRLIEDPSPVFRRSHAANLGAAKAGGDWLLFCSDAVELVDAGWLGELLLHAALPDVGAVGPLLLRPDARTDAAGYAIGLDHPTLPMLAGLEAEADGYYGSLACARDVSAVSGEFMLVRAAAFRELGGFEENYFSGYEDFDLCQRLRRAGLGVVYAPRPRVVVHETPAARSEALDIVDRALFVDRWYHELEAGDPFFNPNFTRVEASFAFSA
jgi:GT2 family glycosyltransferase